MGLTWRDLVSSTAVVAIIVAYVAYLVGRAFPLFSSAAATSALVLVLAAGCAVAAAGDLHTRPQPPLGVIFRRVTTVIGTVALIAGVLGVIGSSGHALEILVVATIGLWATATLWHVLTIGADQ